jgi:benzoylformate decarboxylase
MDQLVSLLAEPGSALMIDCESLEVEAVPVPRGIAIAAVHCGLPRELRSSEYAERRAACEAAAARLGLASLRDAELSDVAGDPFARHVVTENERVPATARALRSADLDALGELFAASHASLRDDFRVSTPELDALVEELVEAGAFGARLTGAGFGGCVVALLGESEAEAVLGRACASYATETGLSPTAFRCRAAACAGPVDVTLPALVARAASTPQPRSRSPRAGGTVREATYKVLRSSGLTTIFANPGSTEIPFLTEVPDDFRFVLGLHEGSVVGTAAGFALGKGEAALVLLHTTAGLGNAVNALATARVNRAPLVVVVGQQDRRHLAFDPFLAGRLQGLAGEYPVWVHQPVRAQEVPGSIARARHEAETGRGPALVIVPMDDWLAPAPEPFEIAAPARLHRSRAADPEGVDQLARLLADARSPALVAGAGADEPATWKALVALAERLACPVWQESFGGRVGFPQDHPNYAGLLPAGRAQLRETLAAHDVVLAVGAPVFRQYAYEPGPLVVEGTRVAVVTEDPTEAHRSPADLALLAAPAAVCAALAELLPQREGSVRRHRPPPAPEPPAPGEPLRASHVLAALAERLPPKAVFLEEAPSSGPELRTRLAAREPLGFLSPAMGGLGFALPAAVGLRMALPERPVVAIVGDGSSLYAIQALWTAAHYRVGVLFVILANGGYAIMDRLAAAQGGDRAWPGFGEIDISALARGFGCPAWRITGHRGLLAALGDVLPGLARREEPLLLEMVVEPDP